MWHLFLEKNIIYHEIKSNASIIPNIDDFFKSNYYESEENKNN